MTRITSLIILFFFYALILVGCNKKTSEAPAEPSNSGDLASKLVGTWTTDMAATLKETAPDASPQQVEEKKKNVAGVSLTFSEKDVTFRIPLPPEIRRFMKRKVQKSGVLEDTVPYKILSQTHNTLTVNVTKKIIKRNKEETTAPMEMNITFISDESMKLVSKDPTKKSQTLIVRKIK